MDLFRVIITNKHDTSLPLRKTRSVTFSPLLAKDVWRELKLNVGAGICLLASEALEIKPSLRPVGTFQNGPPCHKSKEIIQQYQHIGGWLTSG